MDEEEREYLNRLLKEHQDRLRELTIKKATLGVSTPVEVINEIKKISKEIARIEKRLHGADLLDTQSTVSDSDTTESTFNTPAQSILQQVQQPKSQELVNIPSFRTWFHSLLNTPAFKVILVLLLIANIILVSNLRSRRDDDPGSRPTVSPTINSGIAKPKEPSIEPIVDGTYEP